MNTKTMNRYVEVLAKNPDYYRAFERCLEEDYDSEQIMYLEVFAPVLIEFVKWVLNRAVEDGRKRLYFLARDSYQMYIAAKCLCNRNNLDIDCRYLSVSRYAIRLPEYRILGDKCLDKICTGGIDVTFEKVMMRGGLGREQGLEIAGECGYKDRYTEVLNYNQVMELKGVLANSKRFLEYINGYSEYAYPAAIGYLCQEGLMDDVDYALVDSGWVGTLQQSIKRLVRTVNPDKDVTGYYFGLYEIPADESTDSYKGFYFEPGNHIRRKVHFSNSLFEGVFSAPEGMTHHYEEHNGRFHPVFDMKKNPNSEFIEKNTRALENLLEFYECGSGIDNIDMNMVKKLLAMFMGNPGMEEVAVYGSLMFSDDVLEGSMQSISAKLNQEEIARQRILNKTLIMTGLKKGVIHESAWIEGSIVRNGVKVKSNLRHARMYKYFVYIRKRLRRGK